MVSSKKFLCRSFRKIGIRFSIKSLKNVFLALFFFYLSLSFLFFFFYFFVDTYIRDTQLVALHFILGSLVLFLGGFQVKKFREMMVKPMKMWKLRIKSNYFCLVFVLRWFCLVLKM